jgi:hypothetical protein
VAVNLALAVGAPVMVAALGNRNHIVKVFDAVRRSRIVSMATTRSSKSTPRSYDSLSTSSSIARW